MAVGAVLMIAALLLYAYNAYEDTRAESDSEEILSDVMTVIQDHTVTVEADEAQAVMPVGVVNGYEYIGYLSIPDLKIDLPVISDWDYNKLKKAPCRQWGTTYTDDLVIVAHNYYGHFGRLSTLEEGAKVTFTDMDGVVTEYALTEMFTVGPYEIDRVKDSEYDLVLYTCVYSGRMRTVAGFMRTGE